MLALPATVILEAETIHTAQGALSPREEDYIVRACPKRQRQFTAGRILARRALARIGYPDWVLLADKHRCPIWPEGIVGSISHTDSWCVVAVAPRSAVTSLGIDVEEPKRVESNLWRLLFTERETADLAALPENRRQIWAGCLFGIKEAFYKYQFPLTRRMVDFKDVEVSSTPTTDKAIIRLVKTIAAPLVRGTCFYAQYTLEHDLVWTAVYGDPARDTNDPGPWVA